MKMLTILSAVMMFFIVGTQAEARDHRHRGHDHGRSQRHSHSYGHGQGHGHGHYHGGYRHRRPLPHFLRHRGYHDGCYYGTRVWLPGIGVVFIR